MGLDHRVELFVRHVPQHTVAKDPGVRTNDVETSVTFDCAAHEAIRGCGIADGDHFGDRFAASRSDGFDSRLRRRFIDVVDDDRRPGSGQGLRKGETEPSPTAGHNSYFSFESYRIHCVGLRIYHRPKYRGGRFSMNARGPSFASWLARTTRRLSSSMT